MDERDIQKIKAIYKGVELIADGVNSYSQSVRGELKNALSTVHSTILNWIACAVLEAVADRCDFDNRFYPVVKEAARLAKKAVG
jgi:hypothetical protein